MRRWCVAPWIIATDLGNGRWDFNGRRQNHPVLSMVLVPSRLSFGFFPLRTFCTSCCSKALHYVLLLFYLLHLWIHSVLSRTGKNIKIQKKKKAVWKCKRYSILKWMCCHSISEHWEGEDMDTIWYITLTLHNIMMTWSLLSCLEFVRASPSDDWGFFTY